MSLTCFNRKGLLYLEQKEVSKKINTLKRGVKIGRYEVLKVIGVGGMGVVYQVFDTQINSNRAMKEVKIPDDYFKLQKELHTLQGKEVEQDSRLENLRLQLVSQLKSIIAERDILKNMDCPYIPRIYDILNTDTHYYIIMDLLEGKSLDKVIKDEGTGRIQPIEQEQAVKWSIQLCEALHYLHTKDEPIIYRDMKPSNVMVLPSGDIRLFDFGISRAKQYGGEGQTIAMGSIGFAAPEQMNGLKSVFDERTDIYSLGMTLFYMLTGCNPKDNHEKIAPIRTFNPYLSSGLERIVVKATKRNPNERYQTVKEFQEALENYNQYDIEKVKESKKKLKRIQLSKVVLGLLTVVSIGYHGLKVYQEQQQVQNLISAARTHSTLENWYKIQAYSLTKEQKIESILESLKIYKKDGNFTLEEEKGFNQYFGTSLVQNLNHYDVYNELGKLYWYYYGKDGGIEATQNNVLGKSVATGYFDKALLLKESPILKAYIQIGKFNDEVLSRVAEADDVGIYKATFDNIELLVEKEFDLLPELVQLDLLNNRVLFIERYSKQLRVDGLTSKDLALILENTKIRLDNLQTTVDKTQTFKTYIQKRLEIVLKSLNISKEV